MLRSDYAIVPKKEDMMAIDINTLDSARPFRIFVSLLDRWEVGYPLSMALVYDALTVAMQVDQNGGVEEIIKENVRCCHLERERSILSLLNDYLRQGWLRERYMRGSSLTSSGLSYTGSFR
jgi:hypothetical protein